MRIDSILCLLGVICIINIIKPSVALNSDKQSLIPLNFNDAISKLRNQMRIMVSESFERIKKSIPIDANVSPYPVVENIAKKLTARSLTSNVSEECVAQLKVLGNALSNKDEWALMFIDSFGKVPSGILNGNLGWFGEIGECRNVSDAKSNFTGKYTILIKPIDPIEFYDLDSIVKILKFFFFY